MVGHRLKGLLFALLTGVMTVGPGTAAAQENRSEPRTDADVPEGQPSRISDWALAGVLWSDAHLVRRVAAAASQEASNDTQRQRMQELQRECDVFIDELKTFGWQRIEQSESSPQRTAQANASAGKNAAAEANNQPGQVPDPDRVGQKLEQQIAGTPQQANESEQAGQSEQAAASDRTGARGASGATEPAGERQAAPPGTLDRRVNTETPAGADDPGIDDEAQPKVEWFDLSQYRVDDFADEMPVEERNTADAVEDGVEGALAAGIDNSPSNFDVTSRISERELMTRSRTLPVGEKESIYDTDDYDPNLDFEAENPKAVQPGADDDEGPSEENFQDEPGLEDRLDSEELIDNENETVRALTDRQQPAAARSDAATEQSDAAAESDQSGRSTATPLAPYTDQAKNHRADARWVQFHMSTNQRRWDMITREADPQARWKHLRASIVQLRSDAETVRGLTDHPELIQILDAVAGD